MPRFTKTVFYSFLLLVLLIGIRPSLVNAQSVTWSQPLNDSKKVPYLRILGSDEEDNFYILRSNISLLTDRDRAGFRNKVYVLQRFAPDLSLRWEKELRGPLENSRISDVSLINGKIIVTYFTADKKSKQYVFYCSTVTADGKWDGKVVELDRFLSDDFDEDNRPGMIASQDQQTIAFTYRKVSEDKQSQIFSVVTLDTALNIQYKRDLMLKVPMRLFMPVTAVVTNQSSVFILGLHYLTEKKVKAPEESFYDLFGYNKIRDDVVHYELKSDKQFLTDIGMCADNANKNMVVSGFYSDRTTYSTAGIFYYSLSEDSLTEKKMITTPFPASYIQKFIGERKDVKTNELTNFSIDRVLVRRDGGAGIIAESYFESSRSYYDYYMQMFIQHYYYHYGSVMLLSINPDGQILWNNVISKDQNSTDDGGYYSSYFGGTSGGKIFAIYNKYIEETSSVMLTTVDGSGKQKTDVLFSEMDKVTIIPRSSRQIDDDTILVPAYRQNKFYITKISF